MAEIKFYVAGGPASGMAFSGLGGGVYDHIGLYSSEGISGLVGVGQAQDITWLVDDAGVPNDTGNAASGQMNNNKWIDPSGVSINSGSRVDLSSVVSSGSGTIRIEVSDAADFFVENAKLYAYDGSDIANDPSGLWVLSYEIIDTAVSGTGDTEWALIDATNYNYMVDRVSGVQGTSGTSYNYSIGLSVRPKVDSTSGYQSFGLAFSCDIIQ